MQRFIPQDPIGIGGGPNFYSCVANAPTIFIDPFGLDYWSGGVQYNDSGTPTGELGLQPDPPVPDVSIGLDSPLGGVETTLPFHSGGDPTTVTNTGSTNVPIPFAANACVRGQFGPEPGQVSLDVSVTTPLGGVDTTLDVYNQTPSTEYTSPQINFALGPGANGYIGFKY